MSASEELSPLALRRLECDYTQESLADEMEVTRRTVQRWESRTRRRMPKPWTRRKLAKVLQVTPVELDELLGRTPSGTHTCSGTADWETAPGASAAYQEQPQTGHLEQRGHGRGYDDPELALGPRRQPDSPEIDDMHRREVLRISTMVAAMLALQPADDDSPANEDLDDATNFAEFNASLWQVYARASSKALVLPVVQDQLGVLTSEFKRSRGLAKQQELSAALGDLHQLEGEILFDGNDYAGAANSYDLAAKASEAAGDFDMWACAMTRHSFLSVYERRYDEAAPMLDLAAQLAGNGDTSLSTRYWVAAVQAETFAGLGDLSACQRALDIAEHVRGLTGTVHNGGWLRFDGSRLPEQRGTCYATLGRYELAEAALNDALRLKLSARRRASVLTDLVIVGAHRRDPDRVAAHVRAAIADARTTNSDYIRRKLTGLQRHLVPLLADKQVRQLSGEIKALTPPPNAR